MYLRPLKSTSTAFLLTSKAPLGMFVVWITRQIKSASPRVCPYDPVVWAVLLGAVFRAVNEKVTIHRLHSGRRLCQGFAEAGRHYRADEKQLSSHAHHSSSPGRATANVLSFAVNGFKLKRLLQPTLT